MLRGCVLATGLLVASTAVEAAEPLVLEVARAQVLMAPVIREPIRGGSGQIASGFKLDEAKELAGRLSSGHAKMEIEAVD